MREVSDVGFHAGIHHGVAVFRDGDYFGRAVNLAARLLGAAHSGELLATREVAARSPEHRWLPRGPKRLRGFAEPLEICSLDLADP
jgi:adenylate cyclase